MRQFTPQQIPVATKSHEGHAQKHSSYSKETQAYTVLCVQSTARIMRSHSSVGQLSPGLVNNRWLFQDSGFNQGLLVDCLISGDYRDYL